jgi:transposase-like protein
VLECPVCGSDKVRFSFSTPAWEFIYRWQGLQRYRCRECRKAFHVPLGPGEEFAKKPPRKRRERITTNSLAIPTWQRKLLETALFVAMVAVLYAALRAVNF